MPLSSTDLLQPARAPIPVEIVVIGASTGGPNALARLLSSVPSDFPVPIVIVQHMPPEFTRHMAERLAARTSLDVREASDGQPLRAAQVWIAPGDYHLILAWDRADIRLRTNQGQPENSCRPSVDVLFRSAAAITGAGTLAVVLTGMGQDGLGGAGCIREVGGKIIVQDQETSVVWGMPGAIARAGLADEILPLDQLAGRIIQRVRRGVGVSGSGFFRSVDATIERPSGIFRGGAGSGIMDPASSDRMKRADPAKIKQEMETSGEGAEEKSPQLSLAEIRARRAERLARQNGMQEDKPAPRPRPLRRATETDWDVATQGGEAIGPEPKE